MNICELSLANARPAPAAHDGSRVRTQFYLNYLPLKYCPNVIYSNHLGGPSSIPTQCNADRACRRSRARFAAIVATVRSGAIVPIEILSKYLRILNAQTMFDQHPIICARAFWSSSHRTRFRRSPSTNPSTNPSTSRSSIRSASAMDSG